MQETTTRRFLMNNVHNVILNKSFPRLVEIMERIMPVNEKMSSDLIDGFLGPMAIPSVIGSFKCLGSKVLVPRKMRK